MAQLSDTTTKNTQTTTLDTNRDDKALARAAKIRHSAAVPGSTDNDADSWREHLQRTGEQVGEEAAQNKLDVDDLVAATRNLHLVDEPGTWATATDAKVAVGHRTHNNGLILAPAASLWADATAVADVAVVTPSGAGFIGARGPGMNVVVQLPDGADIGDYRLVRRNERADGTSSEGIVSSNRWIGKRDAAGMVRERFRWIAHNVGGDLRRLARCRKHACPDGNAFDADALSPRSLNGVQSVRSTQSDPLTGSDR